jgi:phosphate-selective porin
LRKSSKSALALGAALCALSGAAAMAKGAEANSKATTARWNNGPLLKGEDYEIRVNGRIQYDYNYVETDLARAPWNESELPRLKLGLAGKVGQNVKFKIEGDHDGSGVSDLDDAFVQGTPRGGKLMLGAGQFRTLNSLDVETSDLFTSTFERAGFTDAFDFTRALGGSIEYAGKR